MGRTEKKPMSINVDLVATLALVDELERRELTEVMARERERRQKAQLTTIWENKARSGLFPHLWLVWIERNWTVVNSGV